LVRYGICVGAILWLVTNKNWRWSELKAIWLKADQRLLVAGVLAFGPAPVLIAFRLKLLLAVHNVRLSVWQAIKVTFAGNFIINTLPVGTTGGDSAKAYYIARDTVHKHEAVTTVFFDRVIGVVGLVLLAGGAVLANWRNPAFAGWGRIIGLFALGLAVGSGIYYSRSMRQLLRIDQIMARLPLSAHLQRIDRSVLAFREVPGCVLACLALSVVLQLICIVSLFLAGWALGLVGTPPVASFGVYVGFMPIGLLAGAQPLGGMEVTFSVLLADIAGLGTSAAAVSLALFGRLIQLVWALPGMVVVLRARPDLVAADELLE